MSDSSKHLNVLSVAALILLAAASCTPTLIAQDQSFSSTPDYKAMMHEVHQDPQIPSHLGAGTLLQTAKPPTDLAVKEDAAGLRLSTDAWTLQLEKRPWAMALTNKKTGLTWRLAGTDASSTGLFWMQGEKATALPIVTVLSINRHEDTWKMEVEVAGSTQPVSLEITVVSPTVIRLSIRAPQNIAGDSMGLNFSGAGPFFGLGERFDQVNLNGLKTELRPMDLLGTPGHNWTYIPVPFLFSPHGLGMYLDSGAVSTFDLKEADQQKFSIQLKDASVDAYFFVGGPKDIVENYTGITGRTPLSPPWAFGVWICSYQNPQTVLADARRLRQEKIPSSAIWTFDAMDKGDIMGWPLWWTGYYPNLQQFTDQLHGMGFKALTYVHPYIRSKLDPYNLPNPSFEEGEREGRFIQPLWSGTVEPYLDGNIDFTSPTTVDWWAERIRNITMKDNFDGWMEDFGEWVNDKDHFASGVTGIQMENLNPLIYHKLTYEIAHKAKPDVVEFVRSGYAGSQGYTRVVWGGDQFPDWTEDHGLPSVVKAGITAGLVGFSVWGPDIDGNGFSTELWTRWVEFGALTPVMRTHPWDKPYGAVDLWYNKQTIDTFRRYAQLHVSLFPYFNTYAHEATKTGLPIMRHLLLEYPDDAKTYDLNAEYMLGEKILVAPVIVKGATTRSLYLPQGSWVNYWTGKILDGGREVTVAAPLEQIPMMVSAGSVLPLISPDTDTLASDLAGSSYRTLSNDLTWRVFPSAAPAKGSFTLYDGTVAEATQDSLRIDVQVKHSPNARKYEVVVPMTQVPREVTLDGKPLSKIENGDGVAEKQGWRIDQTNQTLHAFFQGDDFELHIAK